MDNRAIGLRISRLREKLGLTTGDLARKVGLSQAQISRLENGKQGFRSATLTKIAKALGVRPVHFFIEEGDGASVAEAASAYGIRSQVLLNALRDKEFREAAEKAAQVFERDRKAFEQVKELVERLPRSQR